MTTSSAPEIYCVKRRTRTESKDGEAVTMKNGRPATRATCVPCGTRKLHKGAVGWPRGSRRPGQSANGSCQNQPSERSWDHQN